MEHTFKGSLFGGFNRSDVTKYIEQTALEAKDRIDALEKETDGLCRENSDLRTQLDSVTAARDRLSDSFEDTLKQHNGTKAALIDTQAQLSAAREKLPVSFTFKSVVSFGSIIKIPRFLFSSIFLS